ncbi:bifunctional phosphopantothenoylcysteine decarboxylase/phosphopantothenate--cysteine ligase CoaBC [Citricoccus sp.]|uniref:bifunctional phosphopantothenoylcysteine decarboxylase/phosphopantothenate--cysteine ligase CoaBC n=1 Tax=Citricoccus sp. TaxID=1978372 RepID=UPI00261FE3C3|nr:bifunctional phosphopantothenoylcysteine decarboxylase/phosphopantothenate--cysteine ligase CoaBC [Citricoccus sp.]HRO30158.1 bifunctional phosphopantothenoylcysteine decarboxylase/phosphopantothenate--cysteine ligase CoaBC [Citricoccus sp.]HRO94176.1 bifunctional phosphopantothenoylcysteine decarboxylase/phosphopantothenate--cysteine ligase CoaBC [Citricoccus sp.]
MRIVLGVTGGIAAYKSALLLRLMTEAGHTVDVVPTPAALGFVGKATWEALSGRPVRTDTFEAVETVNHVRLGREAELVVVAPATADAMARAAAGLAPDLLGNVLLTATCPVLVVPAMHTEMWQNPATVANVATLRSRGITVMDPDSGRLTGQDTGPGRFPEPERIWAEAQRLARPTESPEAGPLAGRTVVVTAGGTREALDPVRYLGNRSSGKQGVALAQAAAAAGATVRFIGGAMSVEPPAGTAVTRVESTQELHDAVMEQCADADALIMAAAVADFRPTEYADAKIKKSEDGSSPVIHLERTPDILAGTVRARAEGRPMPGVIVGFGAETGDAERSVLEHGAAKLARKGCEMLVVNQVGRDLGFGQDVNEVTMLFADGRDPVEAAGSKADVAAAVVDQLAGLLRG